MNVTASDLISILPALSLIGGALAVVGVDAALRRLPDRIWPEILSFAALSAALLCTLYRLTSLEPSAERFGGAVMDDALTLVLTLIIVAGTGLTILLSSEYVRQRGIHCGEYYALVLLAAAGMILLTQSHDLITLFISLEIFSLCLYVLSGFLRRDPRSNEAAIKYFVTGAFATGVLLYGMALLYGATGSLSLAKIGSATAGAPPALQAMGLALLAVGLCFKVGAVPFHSWVPDVYEGAPTAVTAFMSVTVKAAGFGTLLRLFAGAGAEHAEIWGEMIPWIAMVTMVVGNLFAIRQQSVKRMLAYSSIAHTGYLLVGIAAIRSSGTTSGGEAALYYLYAYTFMTLGAFAFLIYAGRGGNDAENLQDYAGLARRRPWAAAAMTIFMISLAGIPPTAGFFGKFMVFKAALAAGHTAPVIVGVLASAVSVYYYLRVVVYMYMREEEAPPSEQPAPGVMLVVATCTTFSVLLGLAPSAFVAMFAAIVRMLQA